MLTNPQCKQEDKKTPKKHTNALKREKPCEKHQGTKKQRLKPGLSKIPECWWFVQQCTQSNTHISH